MKISQSSTTMISDNFAFSLTLTFSFYCFQCQFFASILTVPSDHAVHMTSNFWAVDSSSKATICGTGRESQGRLKPVLTSLSIIHIFFVIYPFRLLRFAWHGDLSSSFGFCCYLSFFIQQITSPSPSWSWRWWWWWWPGRGWRWWRRWQPFSTLVLKLQFGFTSSHFNQSQTNCEHSAVYAFWYKSNRVGFNHLICLQFSPCSSVAAVEHPLCYSSFETG